MSTVAEDMSDFEGNSRFIKGRNAGRFDKGADVNSDLSWLTTKRDRKHENKIQNISFKEIDPMYVKGYEVGYEEGPQEGEKEKF